MRILLIILIGLSAFNSYASNTCVDFTGKYEGLCQEFGADNKIALYKMEITQDGCSSVTVKIPFFKDTFYVDQGLSAAVHYSDGAYHQSAGSFFGDTFTSTFINVSKDGFVATTVTQLNKSELDGVESLKFTQQTFGFSKTIGTTCEIPSVN